MKQVLFVRPDSCEGGKIMWCESGSQRVETLESLDALAEHPLAARVCLLLPGYCMIFRHFTLPKKVASQATAFSWMAEETRSAMWITFTGRYSAKGAEVDAVAIDADALHEWLRCFQQSWIKVIQALPDTVFADGGEAEARLLL